MKKLFVCLFIILTILVTGCSSEIAIMQKGNTTSDKMEYDYFYFDGIKRAYFHMKEDINIKLDYDLNIKKGNLTLEIIDNDDKALWSQEFNKDTEDEIIVKIKEKGIYKIVVKGEEAKGGFEINYSEVQ
ncbi:MAG: hypothetical protein ACLFMO_02185 [Eubacteriales bacterium]